MLVFLPRIYVAYHDSCTTVHTQVARGDSGWRECTISTVSAPHRTLVLFAYVSGGRILQLRWWVGHQPSFSDWTHRRPRASDDTPKLISKAGCAVEPWLHAMHQSPSKCTQRSTRWSGLVFLQNALCVAQMLPVCPNVLQHSTLASIAEASAGHVQQAPSSGQPRAGRRRQPPQSRGASTSACLNNLRPRFANCVRRGGACTCHARSSQGPHGGYVEGLAISAHLPSSYPLEPLLRTCRCWPPR